MENLHPQIMTILKRIDKFYTYDYLYSGFDKLIKILETQGSTPLNTAENYEVRKLLTLLAADSKYNNYASANWLRYSARCFYCADALVKYIHKEDQKEQVKILNGYFLDLLNSGVAPLIQDEILDKYIQINLVEKDACDFYDLIIRQAINGASRGRTWFANEISLNYQYTLSVKRLLLKYVEEYQDRSLLKKWIPQMSTVNLANVWYRYSECDYRQVDNRAIVEQSLNKMLDIHLELFSFWYWSSSQELIDTLPQEYLIEVLEVIEDSEFEKILHDVVTLPYSDKIKEVLEHFANDDEHYVANMSLGLLQEYVTKS